MPSNPPAFPTPAEIRPDGLLISQQYPGMELRDYFAAKAMEAMIRYRGVLTSGEGIEIAITAQDAYRIADAMLEARSKPAT